MAKEKVLNKHKIMKMSLFTPWQKEFHANSLNFYFRSNYKITGNYGFGYFTRYESIKKFCKKNYVTLLKKFDPTFNPRYNINIIPENN